MSKPVAIALAREFVPAQRFLLFVAIAAFVLGIPHLAHGQSVPKTSGVSHRLAAQPAAPKGVVAPVAASAVSLRTANDRIPTAAVVDAPTGSIRGVAVGKAVGLSA